MRQETILSEAAQRVRRYAGLAQSQKHDRPLIVVVTKFDSWKHLLGSAHLAGRPRRRPRSRSFAR